MTLGSGELPSDQSPRVLDSHRLSVSVTYLQMHEPPQTSALAPPAGTAVKTLRTPPISFYRYLYNAVGTPWLWYERRRLKDQDLGDIIHHPQVIIDTLFYQHSPAGFCEFDMRRWPDLEISYFGLLPEFIGQGLGRYFLDTCVRSGWSKKPHRLWLHTCTLDHPRALPSYLKAGFGAYRTETLRIVDPRKNGLMSCGRLP